MRVRVSLGAPSIWSRSINGDAVDCKSAAFGHAWFDPRILHQIRKCGRVRFIATVLKTVVSKGTVSSNLTVSAKFCLCVYGYPYVSSELTKSLITVPEARSKSGSMPDSAHALDSM